MNPVLTYGILSILAIPATVGLCYLLYNLTASDKKVLQKHANDPDDNVLEKKYPEADLRSHVSTFLNVGLAVSLVIILGGFTLKVYDEPIPDLSMEFDEDFEIEPPQTNQKPPPPPPPPPPEIEVVEDEEILEEEPEIAEVEVEEDEIVEAPPPPEEDINEDEIFQIVEDPPRFPGCESKPKSERKQCADLELMKYLSKVNYPAVAKENDITGKVFVKFVVNKDGSISNVELARDADKYLAAAAIAHVKSMPKWTPGKQRGKAVKVQMIAPFNFKLR